MALTCQLLTSLGLYVGEYLVELTPASLLTWRFGWGVQAWLVCFCLPLGRHSQVFAFPRSFACLVLSCLALGCRAHVDTFHHALLTYPFQLELLGLLA